MDGPTHNKFTRQRGRRATHLGENLAARHLKLTAEDLGQLAALDEGFATHPQHLVADARV
ncbi:MAG: hypothetical protein ACFCBW_08525 [Candidatus Competibacterales bacterium]